MDKENVILSIHNLNKKFSKDIRSNMIYGLQDLLYNIVGYQPKYDRLRANEFWALKDINLDLRSGEILSVVGANGSGKTTLMRIISGIYPLDSGTIKIIPGHKITPIFALRAGMQPLFTGRENISIKGAMFGMSKDEIEQKMEFITNFSELGERLDRPYGNYSSGMQARLAYSVAIATEPDIFIIDEALAVGDSVFKSKCFDHLKNYVKQPGKGVLFVSNNIRKVLKISSRVAILDEGKLIYNSTDIGTALDFYIRNCLKDIDSVQRANKLKRIKDYDL